jgi:adenine-specific DNA-methyltransferase
MASPDVFRELNRAAMNLARGMQDRAPSGLKLLPSLVLRHTAGRLFQEAHAIIESEQLGLFGTSKLSYSPGYSPTGAYFTPVRIARLLTEWALQRWANAQGEIRVADFACGSAVFLTEALRTLERLSFRGTVKIIGRDSSPQAITMAKVALRNVERDLDQISVLIDVCEADAFETVWPEADVVLMNPPFRSWEKMEKREREWVSDVTGGANRGRPDLSVGFAERAMRSLSSSGVLATMIPAGVLASDGMSGWRKSLAQRATPTLIAVLGEHGLFQHALVNVGMVCLDKEAATRQTGLLNEPLHMAWSSSKTGSASKAIRALRRTMSDKAFLAVNPENASGWSVTTTSLDALKIRHSWLPGAGALGRLLKTLQITTSTTAGELFHVHQGKRILVVAEL